MRAPKYVDDDKKLAFVLGAKGRLFLVSPLHYTAITKTCQDIFKKSIQKAQDLV